MPLDSPNISSIINWAKPTRILQVYKSTMRIQRALTSARFATYCCRESNSRFLTGKGPISCISSRTFSSSGARQSPSLDEITKLFKNMETGDYASFFKRVSPNVDWTVMGTHPCAGRYQTLQDFQEETLARLGKIMKDPGLKLKVCNVIGGGESQEWATVELVAHAECTNGFKFDNTYAWCCRFDDSGTIIQVRAYLDSWMVGQALEENENGRTENRRAPVPDI